MSICIRVGRLLAIAKKLTKTLWAKWIPKGMPTKATTPTMEVMVLFIRIDKCVFIVMQVRLLILMIINSYQVMFFYWAMELLVVVILYIKSIMSICLCEQCLEDSSSHCPFPINNSFEHTEQGVFNCLSFWPRGVCLHWGVHQNLDMEFLRTWFSRREISILGRTRCGFPRPKPGNVLDMIFRTWDP
jgi:hypothetical protein